MECRPDLTIGKPAWLRTVAEIRNVVGLRGVSGAHAVGSWDVGMAFLAHGATRAGTATTHGQ